MKATTTPVPDARLCEYDRSRTYGWNGENRLISAENGDTRLEFSYDYMGRRFEKKVYTKGLALVDWSLQKHYKFVYDGYKLTAMYDVLENNALRMTFAWQPDSVDLDVPVSMTCDGETYYYVTDGNKNVTALLDADGVRVAKYTYNPFGRILNSEGALAEINPFRFSSEQYDDETGLVYYNYRYYSPEFGRWIKRDPIGEDGGVNLYAMVGNNPVRYWDIWGQYKYGYDPSTQFDPNHDPGRAPEFPNPQDYYDRDEAARREVEQTFPYENGVYGKIYKRPLWHDPKADEGTPCDEPSAVVIDEPQIIDITTFSWYVSMDSTITVDHAKDLTWAWTTCWRGGGASGFLKTSKNSPFSLTSSPFHSPIKFTVEYLWLSCECIDGKNKKWVKKRTVKGGALWAKNLWTGWRVSVAEGVF